MKIIRGDYGIKKIQRAKFVNEEKQIIKDVPEKMYFTVKQNPYDEEFVFQKTLTSGITIDKDFVYHIEIKPEDTNKLSFGDYVYDIEIKNGDKPKTIIKGTFTIEDEVTHASNED